MVSPPTNIKRVKNMSLSPASQVVERQIDYVKDQDVLIAGEILDTIPQALIDNAKSVQLFTTNYQQYLSYKESTSVTAHFAEVLPDDVSATMLLLYWPKAKQEANYLFNMLLSKLGTGLEVCVVGENRTGVKSAEKLFKPFGRLTKYDSARRCSFYFGICDKVETSFNINDWYKTYPVTLGDKNLTVYSLPGVFSHGELDIGTQLLLNTLPRLKGKVMDFGCGAGIIGSFMKMHNPDIRLEMVDISALAIASSKKTLQENGLEGEVYASNVYSDFGNNYKFIISNPPFHAGKDTSYEAAEGLITQAPRYLGRNGQLIIVANSFLAYPPLFKETFGDCHELDRTTKFKILAS